MTFSHKEFEERIARLQALLQKREIGWAALFDDVSMLYYAGTIQGGALVVPQKGEARLFLRRSAQRGAQESWLKEQIVPIRSFRKVAQTIDCDGPVGIVKGKTTAAHLDLFLKYFDESLPVVDITNDTTILRARKSAAEIEILREAGRRQATVFAQVPDFLYPGETEWTVGSKMRAAALLQGDPGLVRLSVSSSTFTAGVVCYGDSSLSPGAFDGPCNGVGFSPAWPIVGSSRQFKENEHALVDFVFGYEGYFVDRTRIFYQGQLDERLQRAMDSCLKIQQEVVSRLRPGAVPAQIYDEILAYVEEIGESEGFMGLGDNRVSFVGHGIGMVVDEFPVIAPKFEMLLEPGMVLAIEPKIAVPELGMVGVENTWLITDGEAEKLTPGSDEPIAL